jgi:putative membrane protein
MMGDGSWALWGPGVLFMAFCMVMMVRMMGGHGSHGSRSDESHGHGPGGAERILAERLARGEIDVEEYDRRLRVLQRTGELDRT